jgi:hypothetical protein
MTVRRHYCTVLCSIESEVYDVAMRSIVFFLLISFSCLIVNSQTITGPVQAFSPSTLEQLENIQTLALKSDYALRTVKHLSNNIGPRLSGSPQAQKAVEFVAEEMRKLGMEVRLQEIKVRHWKRGEENGALIDFPGMAPGGSQKIVLAALGGSVATPAAGLTAEAVVVDSFEALDKLGENGIKGKIVVFNYRFDQRLQAAGFGSAAYSQAVQFRFRGAMEAAKYGAVGVLVRSAGGSQNRLVHTGSVGYRDGVPKIPAAAISFEDAEMIADLARQGPVKIRFTLTPKFLPDAISYNVIGDITGTEKPDEIVVVGGHLDSWDLGTGAIDNASGVAASMQVAYLLRELKLRPKRTIRVIAFMEEESGGAGSRAYFEENREKVDKHFAAIECDLGASRPIGYLFSGKPEIPVILAPLGRILSHTGASQVRFQEGIGADTAPLTRAGVPSFAPWFDLRTYFNYHHTAADTFDKIDPKEYAELASLVAVMTYGLANMETALPR